MNDFYHYHFSMTFNSNSEISKEDLADLGTELIQATESFLKAKRMKNVVASGQVDVFEEVYRGTRT